VVNQTVIVAMGTHVQTMKITLVDVNNTAIIGATALLTTIAGFVD